MSFDETLEHWRTRLFLSQAQLVSEPLDAVTKQHEVVDEIEREIASLLEHTPSAEHDHARLKGALMQARAQLRAGELVRDRFVSESEARKQRFRAREMVAAQSKPRRKG